MSRNIALVLAGMLLSGLLASLTGFLIARSPEMQVALQLAAQADAGHSNPPEDSSAIWTAMERSAWLGAWVYSPVIALVVGVFVGVFGRQYIVAVSLCAIAPYAVAFSLGTDGLVAGLPFLILYLSIAAAAGVGMSAWRSRPSAEAGS